MKSVILISAVPLDLEGLLAIWGSTGIAYLQSPKRLVVEGGWGWFSIEIDEKLKDEYSWEERAMLAKTILTPYFAQLEYSNPSALDFAVETMPLHAPVLIDNDHGLIRPIGEVKERIRSGISWQDRPD